MCKHDWNAAPDVRPQIFANCRQIWHLKALLMASRATTAVLHAIKFPSSPTWLLSSHFNLGEKNKMREEKVSQFPKAQCGECEAGVQETCFCFALP